jgi:hypothetical protein
MLLRLCLAGPSQVQLLKSQNVLNSLETYLVNTSPKQIGETEIRHGFKWSFIFPFFDLTTCRLPTVRDLGLFALAALAVRYGAGCPVSAVPSSPWVLIARSPPGAARRTRRRCCARTS